MLATRFWPDRYGGVEERLWHVSRQLAATGRDVTVLTENRVGAPAEQRLEPNLLVRRFAPMNCGRWWRWADVLRVNWWRRVIASQPRAQALWCSNPYMTCGAILAGRRQGLIHNPAACNAAMHRLYRRDRRVESMRSSWWLRAIDQAAFRWSPTVVVSSVNLRDQLLEHYGMRDDVHVIPHGVRQAPPVDRSASRRRFGLGDDHWVVGYVGRLDPCKDLDFAFTAAAGALGERGRMLIVGDGPDRARLQGVAAGLGLADRTIWAGQMDEPAEAYAAMDVLVLPSLYESFGLVILEAMAAGVPVIGRRRLSTDRAAVLTASDELIDHGRTGFVVDSLDAMDMARRLAELRDNAPMQLAMARAARHQAALRPWSRVVGDYLNLLPGKAA